VNVKAVEVLSTKFDLTKRGDAEEQLRYLDAYERTLIAEFNARGLTECYRVCALPKADQSVGFLGLDEAIKRWTAAPPRPELGPESIADAPRQIDRMLAKATTETARHESESIPGLRISVVWKDHFAAALCIS